MGKAILSPKSLLKASAYEGLSINWSATRTTFFKMRYSKKDILTVIISLLLFIYIIVYHGKEWYAELFSSHSCWLQVCTKEQQIDGLVKEKFFDSHNHNYNTITVVKQNTKEKNFLSDLEEAKLWDKIKVNDSIKKEKNSLTYYLKRRNQVDTIVIKYDCKDQ